MNSSARLFPLDSFRGLIMIAMAIDHASLLVAKVHSGEFWGMALPEYQDAWWFLTRWITHLCAPGFFFAMGAGVALLTAARRADGWTEGRITRFLVTRGLLLILLQQFLENPAWLLGELSAAAGAQTVRGGGVPGGGEGVMLHLGVLYALGAALVIWGFLYRLPSSAVAAISIAAIGGTHLLMPGPGWAAEQFHPVIRLLVVPGQSGILQVFYPVLPWMGVAGLGVLAGRLLREDPSGAWPVIGAAGAALLLLFLTMRFLGAGDYHPVGAGVIGWLNATKYPPSVVFLAMTLGVNLIVLWALARWSATPGDRNPVSVFGRSALFFYIVHLYLYALMGFAFRSGGGLTVLYGAWLVGLVLLYPLCLWWWRFKSARPAESMWRLF